MTTATSAWEADGTAAWDAETGQRPIRVLLVEDDEDDYLLTRDLLREIGKRHFALDWVATFEEAVAALAWQEHDVYLVDYRLGAHNGVDLWSAAGRHSAPMILLTGLDDHDVDIQAMKAGAADYLVKGQIDAPLLERSIRYAIERKRAEEALKRADRRKDEFLAMLAHELRNPLAPIRNALYIMKQPGTDASGLERVREMMERQVRHMTRMVDDLLDVSRITRGKIELRKEVVDLASVVSRTVEATRALIEDRRHELTVALPPELVLLEADPTRLEQVLTNLLNNAAKYTDQGGQIGLSAQQESGELVVRVKDTGMGVPADMLSRIFEPFVQSDRVLHYSQGGLGIGLTLVRSLVEMHGGTVQVHSDGPGRGSEFVVHLPLLSQRDKIEGSRAEGEGSQPFNATPKRRILVVDDNADAAESLGMLLKLEGHDVRVAHDGSGALAAVDADPPDIVFLDVGMPGMNGYEVAQRLRQRPDVEPLLLVALTGWGQEEDRRRSKEAGFDHHVVKPVEPEVLQELLANW
jgi:signal transduction histidine kinase